jgi:hypothetical protein
LTEVGQRSAAHISNRFLLPKTQFRLDLATKSKDEPANRLEYALILGGLRQRFCCMFSTARKLKG